jgi:hypothetical protein
LLFRLVEKLAEVAVLAELHDRAHLQQPLVHVQEHIDVRHDVRMIDALQRFSFAQRPVGRIVVGTRHLCTTACVSPSRQRRPGRALCLPPANLLDGEGAARLRLATHHVRSSHPPFSQLL